MTTKIPTALAALILSMLFSALLVTAQNIYKWQENAPAISIQTTPTPTAMNRFYVILWWLVLAAAAWALVIGAIYWA